MSKVVDFLKFKERKLVEEIEFIPPRNEGYCPFCNAPTLITRTSFGTEVHTFDPTNMEAYTKVRDLLVGIIRYFKDSDSEVDDNVLVEAFGEGMADFLKEMQQENVKLESSD